MAQKVAPKEKPYLDLPNVAEVFADGVQAIFLDGPITRIVLTVDRPTTGEAGGPPARQAATALRLIMPTPAFVGLAEKINRLMDQLESRGALKRNGS